MDFIIRLKKERKLTIVLVTHDIDEAIKVSNRIIVLSKAPCRLLNVIAINSKTDKNGVKEDVLRLLNN